MNKQLIKRLDDMSNEISSIKEQLIKTDKSFPQDGDIYYRLSSDGEIYDVTYGGYGGDEYDKKCIALGNFFRTEAEAIKARDAQLARVRVLNKLRELEGDWIADWKNEGQVKCSVYYCHASGRFYTPYFCAIQAKESHWYSTKDAWEWVVHNMEADLKLVWGIE